MSLPDRRFALAGLGALALSAMAGCTLTPVHADRGGAPVLDLRYDAPNSRLEQVFYRAISARLGTSANIDAPVLSVSISTSDDRVGLTTVSTPLTENQIIAVGRYTVTRNGQVLASGERSATGAFQTSGQLVANDRAKADAQERVVVALAQTIRLALISELAGQ